MNERIKELILNAGWQNAYTNPKEGFEVVFEDEEHNLACIKKFAELIVKECVSNVNSLKDITADGMISKGYRDWESYSGALDCAEKKIRQHFGVEE